MDKRRITQLTRSCLVASTSRLLVQRSDKARTSCFVGVEATSAAENRSTPDHLVPLPLHWSGQALNSPPKHHPHGGIKELLPKKCNDDSLVRSVQRPKRRRPR